VDEGEGEKVAEKIINDFRDQLSLRRLIPYFI